MKLVPLGDVAEFINGFAFKPEHWGDDGKPIIRIQNLTSSSKEFNRTTLKVNDKYQVKSGDLLVSWSATLDVFIWNREDALLNQHIFKVIPDENKIHQDYFFFALKSIIDSLMRQTHGATMKHITRGKFLATEIPLPPLKTQQKIAEILQQADTLRQQAKQMQTELDQLAQSIFIDMFGDPVLNPKNWEKVQLEEVVEIIRDGPHVSPKYSDNGIPILSTRNIRPGELVLDELKYVSEETYKDLTKKFKPQKGDILLTKGGTTGLAKLVDFDWDFAIWVHLACLRPNKRINGQFFEALLNSHNVYAQSQKYTRGIANKDLGLTRIAKIEFALPPLSLQIEFENKFKRLDKQKESIKQQLNQFEDLFNSLMQKAFKGELVA